MKNYAQKRKKMCICFSFIEPFAAYEWNPSAIALEFLIDVKYEQMYRWDFLNFYFLLFEKPSKIE